MKSTRTYLPLAVLSILTYTFSAFAQETAKKAPVPAPDAQAQSAKLVKDVYGDEYAQSKTATEKQALAKKLLDKASETKDDPANQFVLLRLARDIAMQANDGQTAYQAINAMTETFQVDANKMKLAVLTKLAAAAQTQADHKSIATPALNLLNQVVSQEDFTLADEVGELALGEARKARNKELVAQAQRRITEATELAKAYEEAKTARATVEKTPDDPEANLTVGKYLCFVKGDWDRGVPMLALGKDEALKALAQQELQGAASAKEQTKLGDGWWDLAEKEEGTAKKPIQARAGYWYQKALPGLTGLVKDKVEKRLASVGDVAKTASDEVPDAGQVKTEDHKERVVSAALRWLARHQMADGSWSLQGYTTRCTDRTCTGVGKVSADSGATALGLLPFLAAGQTHRSAGPYRTHINTGLNWLLQHQERDGNLAAGAKQMMYSHGLATIALCEAYGLSNDKRLGAAAQMAIKFIVNAQNTNDGGWRYNPGDAGDTCVTVWQLTALKSARIAGLNVGAPSVFAGVSHWLDSVAIHDGAEYAYQPGTGASDTMTSVGLLCRQYLGAKRNNPMLTGGMNYLMNHLPDEGAPNIYYWYHATQFMHNMSGSEWDTWNRKLRDVVVRTQVHSANECANGSWAPENDAWGQHGGRVMTTSLSALTLEIFYRYLPLYKATR